MLILQDFSEALVGCDLSKVMALLNPMASLSSSLLSPPPSVTALMPMALLISSAPAAAAAAAAATAVAGGALSSSSYSVSALEQQQQQLQLLRKHSFAASTVAHVQKRSDALLCKNPNSVPEARLRSIVALCSFPIQPKSASGGPAIPAAAASGATTTTTSGSAGGVGVTVSTVTTTTTTTLAASSSQTASSAATPAATPAPAAMAVTATPSTMTTAITTVTTIGGQGAPLAGGMAGGPFIAAGITAGGAAAFPASSQSFLLSSLTSNQPPAVIHTATDNTPLQYAYKVLFLDLKNPMDSPLAESAVWKVCRWACSQEAGLHFRTMLATQLLVLHANSGAVVRYGLNSLHACLESFLQACGNRGRNMFMCVCVCVCVCVGVGCA